LRLSDNKHFLLFALIALHIGFWIIRKPPQPSSDDLVYLNNAKAILSGDYILTESPKNHRLIVFAPVAALISVFGESPWVVSFWPLLCSCITLAVLYFFLLKYSSLLHAFASSLLLATNTQQVDYSASLFPDVIVAMFSLLLLWRVYEGRLKEAGTLQNAGATALFFYLGFLTKEIIIFVLPFLLFLFIKDIKARTNQKFWKQFIAFMVLCGIALIATYYILTGDFNFIYHSIETRHNEFYSLQSLSEVVERLTYGPALMFASHVGYIVLLLFVLVDFRKRDNTNSSLKFISNYFWILLALYWLLPISLQHFTPIHLDPRMWMLLLPPLYVFAGFNAAQIIQGNIQLAKKMVILFLAAAVLALIFVSAQRAIMFMTFALSCIAVVLLSKKNLAQVWQMLILLLPAVLLALRFTTANSNFLPQ
jgi:4-amino-4-deoxy-L-arabinose transferase-like glycosyltransferase